MSTCPQGMLKGPCKHRTVVSLSQNLPSFDVVPELNPEMRKCGCTLGQGSTLISTNSCHLETLVMEMEELKERAKELDHKGKPT